MERMSLLSVQGAGVLSRVLPDTGSCLPVAFRLSTHPKMFRCTTEVLAHLPTTPEGVALKKRLGKGADRVISLAAMKQSATSIFRMEDVQRNEEPSTVAEAIHGFSIRFVDLDAEDQKLLQNHVMHAIRLQKKLDAKAGDSVTDARLSMTEMFHEGDLSKRALDW